MSDWKPFEASKHAQNTTNPIRNIVDRMKCEVKTDKPLIALSIGDPTTDGNLLPPQCADDAIIRNIKSHNFNGYPPSVGYARSREAVAKYWTRSFAPNAGITADDIILSSGASHALVMAITGLCNPGDTLIIPKPCFSLYGTVCDSYGINIAYYKCLPEKDWEVDVADLKRVVDENRSTVKALLINNPSNPCGSNFTKGHVETLIKVAEENRLPIISDEIYAGLVFSGNTFHSVADFESCVPRVVVGGTAKNFICPGWRMGWLITVDPNKIFCAAHQGFVSLSTLIVGPNSLIQASLEDILNRTDMSYTVSLAKDLEVNARLSYDLFQQCEGLAPTTPQGAMYLMVKIDIGRFKGIENGVDFAKLLMMEQNVQVLPGEIFHCPNFFRIVYTKPEALIREAIMRIQEFCTVHTI
eukprot:Tbor_TRINITY_DN5620_c0_g1::TRINITY_DN5620_c0_g1_i4::g.9093::m.9093/K00815/TAT; tyrosine aminotransferase